MTYLGIGVFLILVLFILLIVIVHNRRILNHQIQLKKQEEQYARQLLISTIESQENERQKLAEDLHDELGAMLSNVRLGLISVSSADPVNHVQVNQVKENLDETINRMRAFSRELHPRVLQESGLYAAITSVARMYNTTAGKDIVVSGDEIDKYVKNPVDTLVYRIIMEVLDNLVKHDDARRIDIQCSVDSESITICVTHDGKGFNHMAFKEMSETTASFGLKNINHRLNLLSGSILYSEKSGNKEAETIITFPIVQKRLT